MRINYVTKAFNFKHREHSTTTAVILQILENRVLYIQSNINLQGIVYKANLFQSELSLNNNLINLCSKFSFQLSFSSLVPATDSAVH